MAQKYHFTGIGGVGMAGVAFLLKKAGHDVSGCDLHPSPRTRWLEANGIPVALGHDPSHITPDLDICVFTPAVPKDNAEFKAAEAAPCRVRYRGEVLADIFNAATDGIAVCGTHGKTTTATFITKLLRALGDDPGWCIGGETDDFPVAGTPTQNPKPGTRNQKPETRNPFIIEADESDGTLALYRAKTLVVTSLDYDHPDHFRTYDDYLACYKTAMAAAGDVIESSKLPTEDWLEIRPLVLGEHNVRNARTAVEVALRRGHSREAILAALPEALAALPDRRFERIWPSHGVPSAECRAPSAECENSVSECRHHLTTTNYQLSTTNYQLPTTNYQLSTNIFTDYAHHPAEIACALSMARALKPKRLRVMFQPHRYSRTKTLLNEFPPAFAEADEVVLVPVYPAFEEPILGGDIADLYLAFRNPQPETRNLKPEALLLARSAEEAWRHLYLTLEPGDLIMLLGAGDLINLVPRILEEMSTEPETRNPKLGTPLAPLSFFRTGGVTYGHIIQDKESSTARHPQTQNSKLETQNSKLETRNSKLPTIIGMGSNTWFSDCATNADILKAPEGCSAAHPGASLLAAHPELAFMAGIPGTIGGWAKMNAGAFGDSFGNHIDSVIADGRKIPAAECGFGYRTSTIPGLITEVILKPAPRTPHPTTTNYQLPTINHQLPTTNYLARRKKFPPRTCGSVFKNPSPEQPAGKLLEEVGAKSLRVGGASVWSEHANVIVAGDGCTSSDILALARLMAARVRDRFGISLVPEIRGLEV